MNKIMKFFAVALSAALIIFNFTGCFNLFNEEETDIPYITIDISDSARTINPEVKLADLSNYELKGTIEGKETTYFTGKKYSEVIASKISLQSAGKYIFTLTATVNEMKYSGTISKDIAGGENALAFEMTPAGSDVKIMEGKGSYEITLNFSDIAGISKAKIQLNDFATGTAKFSYSDIPVEAKTMINSNDSIDTGTYEYIISFYNADNLLIGTYSDVMNISKGLKSKATISITESFKNLYFVTYVLSENETIVKTYSRLSTINSFPADAEILKKGYKKLSDWYTNSSFTGDTVTEITPVLGGTRLYAKMSLPVSKIKAYLDSLPDNTASGSPYEVFVVDTATNIGELTEKITRKIILNLSYYNNLEKIDADTFKECINLTGLILPSSLKEIEAGAFAECTGLINMSFAAACDYFITENSLLMDKNKKRIFFSYPNTEIKNLSIPDTVIGIENRVFTNWTALETIDCPSLDAAIQVKDHFTNNKNCRVQLKITTEEDYNRLSGNLGLPENLELDLDISEVPITSIEGNKFAGVKLHTIALPSALKDIGTSAFNKCFNLISIDFPATLETLGDSAFQHCKKLTSITLPKSLTHVYQYAFRYCYGLSSVTFEEGISATFDSDMLSCCTSLKELKIPDTVKMNKGMFLNCSELTTVEVNLSKVLIDPTTVPEHFAQGCTKLQSIPSLEGIEKIDNEAFKGCESITSVILPDSLKEIETNAFADCKGLETLVIPDNVDFKSDSFTNCSGLKTLSLPTGKGNFIPVICAGATNLESIKIGDKTYTNTNNYFIDNAGGLIFAQNLKGEVTLPDTITSISDGAFTGCKELTKITLNKGLLSENSENNNLFSGCTSLSEIVLNGEGEEWNFSNGLLTYNNKIVTVAGGATSVTIDNSITGINTDAFSGCSNLKKLIFKTNVNKLNIEKIGYLLNSCTGIKKIEMLATDISSGESEDKRISFMLKNCGSSSYSLTINNVTEIKENLFEQCSKLKSINLPDVITIGKSAFADCTNLTEITISKKLTTIGANAFSDCGAGNDLIINFIGTEGEWNTLERSLDINVFNGGNYTVQYITQPSE